jgi:inner membrane protein involved in colicin E2 resistance
VTTTHKPKPDTYAVYEHYRNETFNENGKTESVKILRFKYGWLPIELMLETIDKVENKTDKIYSVYAKNEYTQKTRHLHDDYLNYSELKDTLGLENLLL